MFIELKILEIGSGHWKIESVVCDWVGNIPAISCNKALNDVKTKLCFQSGMFILRLLPYQMPKILVQWFRFCTECVAFLKQLRVKNEGFMSNLIIIKCFILTVWTFRLTGYITMDSNTDYCLTSGAPLKAPKHCVMTAGSCLMIVSFYLRQPRITQCIGVSNP